jgi:hypothetical protein
MSSLPKVSGDIDMKRKARSLLLNRSLPMSLFLGNEFIVVNALMLGFLTFGLLPT